MGDHAPGPVVVGVGASRGVPVAEVVGLIEDVLREAGLPSGAVAALATVDRKAGEPGLVRAAARLGVPLVTYSARELAAVEVPHPSDLPLAALGTPSVAEAAALVGGGELLVPKRKSAPADGRPARVTCAVASAGAGAPGTPGCTGPAAGRHDDHHARGTSAPVAAPPPPSSAPPSPSPSASASASASEETS
ncbi:cobalamin biosynthesis protein CbiG [Streptomyces scabiei]|uniref:Cobalamin biosynthesis protein CbiG n=1 Tax=Streptomyces scabiei TaxID=1930 RepID=A0A100JL20_STRSC|nr:cobalamin biosynthesis protein CbiG [Streptomyces scabiei]